MSAILTSLSILHLLVSATSGPVSAPRRVISVDEFAIKCSAVSSGNSGSGFSMSASAGNMSGGGGASGPEPLQLGDPNGFSQGLAEILKSALAENAAWTVVDTKVPPPGAAPPTAEELELAVRPQFLIRATVVDLNVSSSSGGINISALGGGEKQIKNKVVLDLKLVAPVTGVILETVRAVGTKTTKNNFLSAYAKDDMKVFNWDQFRESPLAEAADLAIKDGVKKLAEKLGKYPWEAEVVAVIEENGKQAIYLNVGPDSGLKLDQELEVIIPGAPILDKKSGKVLGRARPTLVGRVRVVDVDSELVVVEALEGITVESGMAVRLPGK